MALPQNLTASFKANFAWSCQASLAPVLMRGSSTGTTRTVTPDPNRKHCSRKDERGICQAEVTKRSKRAPCCRTIALVLKTSSKVERLLGEATNATPAGLPNRAACASRSFCPKPLIASLDAAQAWASWNPAAIRWGVPGKTIMRSAFAPTGEASGARSAIPSGSPKPIPARMKQASIIFLLNTASPFSPLSCHNKQLRAMSKAGRKGVRPL